MACPSSVARSYGPRVKALRIDLGVRVAPFDEAASAAWVGDATADAHMTDALKRRGISLAPVIGEQDVPDGDGPWVIFADHAYATDKCLGDFLAAASDVVIGKPGATAQLWLAKTPSSDYTRPASSVAVAPLDESGPGSVAADAKGPEAEAIERIGYNIFLHAGPLPGKTCAEALAALAEQATPVVVKKRELGFPIRLPLLGDESRTTMIFPVTSTVACHIESWVHILWLNHLMFGIRWNEILRGHKLWAFGRAASAFPYNVPALTKSFVRKGKNVRIHPTAHVEASVLGDDVVIGARASVRNSILGKGVEVADHASVIASTVGDGAYVTPKTFLVWSCAYPESVISNYKLQMSVVGRGAATSQWAGFVDAKIQGDIAIMVDGEKRSTERSFLGSCLGHHGYVGAKVLLLPGREVPNDAFITMRPDELINTVPSELPANVPVMRDGGTLVPIRPAPAAKS